MMRAFLSPRLLLLAAALVALAVLLAPGAQPAQAQSAGTFWSATLTAENVDGNFFGCSDGGRAAAYCNLTSVLTDDDFTHAQLDYAVATVTVATNGQLEFATATAIPADLIAGGILHVDGTQFRLDAATVGDNGRLFTWSSSGLSWSVGDTIQLRLTIPPPAPGSLDLTFNPGGKLVTPIGSADSIGYAVAAQSDGKIVVAGYSNNGTNDDFAVARYNTDGSLDTGFGTDGKVTTAIGSGSDVGRAMAVQSDGKIVVAGYSSNGTNDDFAVARYNADGTLDTGFGTGGKATTAIGSGSNRAYAVAIHSDGKIVVAGESVNSEGDNDIAVVRYTADGALDTTFSTDGKATTTIGSDDDVGRAVAVQSDGKIVVAGYSYNGSDTDFAVVRYTAAGALDTTFSTDGKVTTTIGSDDDVGNAVAVQSDGKIVVAGYSHNGTNDDIAVVRYTAAGVLDITFSTDGKVTTAIGSDDDWGNAVAVQSDGKIVVAGSSKLEASGIDNDFAMVRYTAAGALDTGFGTGGKATIDIGSVNELGSAIAIQSDGKIVVAGRTTIGALFGFAVARYTADGAPDITFNPGGKVVTGIGSGSDEGYAVAVQSDGKIVVAGYSYNGTNDDFAVARYNADGTLDTGFGSDGKVTTAIGSTSIDRAFAVAVDSDGKIVVAGHTGAAFNEDFAVVRYTAAGALDTSFSTDGKVTTAIGADGDSGRAVAVQSDGKIVVAGYSDNGTYNDFAVVRYTSAGALDAGFGTGGIATTVIGSANDLGNAVAVQSDGKIVVAGSSEGTNHDFAVVRYTAAGALDTSFSTDGKATTLIGSGNEQGQAVAVQSDGKIVVAGYSIAGGAEDFAVVRYTAAGALDTSFSTDGKVTTAIGSGGEVGNAVAVQSDGKIVVAGYSSNGSDNDFAVARYTAAGALDTTFSTDGKVTTAIGSGDDYGYGVAIQSDGKIVVAGNSNNGSDNDFAVVRYNGQGSSDTTPSTLTVTATPACGSTVTDDSVTISLTFQVNPPAAKLVEHLYASGGTALGTNWTGAGTTDATTGALTSTLGPASGVAAANADGLVFRLQDEPSVTASCSWQIAAPPATAPAAPTNLAAAPGDGQLVVTWTAPSGTVTGYDVEYKVSTASSWTDASHAGTGTSQTITSLNNGTLYNVRVRAVNSNGDGPWATTTGTPTAPATGPSAPTSLAVGTGDGQLVVTWAAPALGTVTGYDVEYKVSIATSWTDASHTGTGTSQTITSLDNGTLYDVRVRAVTANGNGPWATDRATPGNDVWSATLTVANIVPAGRGCGIGAGPAGCDNALTDDTFTYGGGGYAVNEVVVETNGTLTLTLSTAIPDSLKAATLNVGNRQFPLADATVSTLGTGEGRARWANSGLSWSVGQQVQLSLVPPHFDPPTNLLAAPGDRRLDVSWTAPTGTVTGYDVEYKLSPERSWKDASHAGTGTSLTIAGLVNGWLYEVRVRAVGDAGDGAWATTSGTPTDAFWFATLTVKSISGVTSVGCVDTHSTAAIKCSTPATLTDNTFTFGGVEYKVTEISLLSTGGILGFDLDKNIPDPLKNYTLHVGNTPVDLSSCTVAGDEVVCGGTGLSWSAGDTVRVSLGPPFRPVDLSEWAPTLGVKQVGGGSRGCKNGVSGAECSSLSLLGGADGFTYTRNVYGDSYKFGYVVRELYLTPEGDLVLAMNQTIPRGFTLVVDGRSFPTGHATLTGGESRAQWSRTGLRWEAGISVVELGMERRKATLDYIYGYWDEDAAGDFTHLAPAIRTGYGYRVMFPGQARYAKLQTFVEHDGSTLRVGKVTWDSNNNKSVAWMPVTNGALSHTIRLDKPSPVTIVYVEVTDQGTVKRYTVNVDPPAGPDRGPTRTYSVGAQVRAAEGEDAGLTITLSEAAPAEGAKFSVLAGYGDGGATADDLGSIPSPVTISEGSDTLTVAVPIVDDRIDEDDETFTLTVTPLTAGWPVEGGRDTATVTIEDDDTEDDETAGVTVNAATPLNVEEGGTATYTVVLDSRPTHDVTINAVSGDDDAATVFPASITIAPENWNVPETFTVSGASDADTNDETVGISHRITSQDGKYAAVPVGSVSVAVSDTTKPPEQGTGGGGTAPANVRVAPGDGTLTVSWAVTPRDGVADEDIRHALRWSQESGVWANPTDPYAGGPEDGVVVEGGVYSYTITGLENGVATGVFVRSFTGNSYSERSEHSSEWVRVKGENTTPVAGQQEQEQPNRAPTVSAALDDVTVINGDPSGAQEVSLSGVFSDADGDELTITAASSDETVALAWITTDQSGVGILGDYRGTATVTVTADDGNGGTVADTFTVTVKAAPVVASAIADVTGLEAEAEQTVLLPGVFSDADGDALTITAASSNTAVATVSVTSNYGTLTVTGVAAGTATVTMTARDSDGNEVSDTFDVSVVKAPEAQEPDPQQQQVNQSPTVSSAIADATIVNQSGTKEVTLSGVFDDADNDDLTITAGSSGETVATVSVSADYSTLTVTAQGRGTATVTVTADDGNGGTVSDTFTVTVKAAPVVASAIGDISNLTVDATRDISLSGVFSDADGDALTISAASSDSAKATVTVASDLSKLTVAGVAEGTTTITVTAQDSDGNRVSDAFDVSVVKAPEPEQQEDVGPEPANVRVVPGDGTLTVSWTVTSRDGVSDGDIKHALRWSQESGVWANPTDPRAGGPEDGIAVAGGVYSYTITGLENGVATGVFVRSFTGSSYSERSEHSSQWVRTKGEHTTPRAE